MQQTAQKQTSRSIFRNVLYGSLTWFLPLAMSFVATPVIIRSLGNNDYGIYALVLGFISYSFTFSFGRAITKYVAEYRISNESEKINDVISATVFINLIVGLFGVTLMCMSADWLVREVFRIAPESQAKAVIAIYAAAAVIFLWMLSQVFVAVLQGVQRFDIYSKIYTSSSFVLTAGNLSLAYFGFGLVALLMWNAFVLAIFFAIYGFAAKRLLPQFSLRLRPHRDTVRLVLRYSAGIVGYQVLSNILLLFERGWITQRLGTESLTYYVVPMAFGLYMHGFVTSLVLVIFPLASELKNERDKLLRLYTKATKVVTLIVVFVVASVVVQSTVFLRLWMGEPFAAQASQLLIVHIVTFALVGIMSISWQMTEGLGHPQYNALVAGVSTAIGITLMLLLTNSFGNLGIAIARLAAFASVFVSIFVVERWFFGAVQFRFWIRLLFNLAMAAIPALGLEFALNSVLPVSWPSLILSVLLGGVVYSVVLWFLDFVTSDEKLLIRQVLSR
jgi:O-antigen/teichoic acid export membrane protein